MQCVEISFLNCDCLIPAFGGRIGTKIGEVLQYVTVGQLSFPLVSSVSALFYARRILYSASLLRLSVRPSVCPSIGLSQSVS